jgi:hypothetical protein
MLGHGGSDENKQTQIGPCKTSSAAKREAVKLRNRLESKERAQTIARVTDLGTPDGSLGWYSRAMDHVAAQVVAGGGKESREDLKALAMASTARRALHDLESQRQELDDLRALVSEMLTAREHGTRIQSTGTGPAGAARPVSPVH